MEKAIVIQTLRQHELELKAAVEEALLRLDSR
jgi:hypothetical protein